MYVVNPNNGLRADELIARGVRNMAADAVEAARRYGAPDLDAIAADLADKAAAIVARTEEYDAAVAIVEEKNAALDEVENKALAARRDLQAREQELADAREQADAEFRAGATEPSVDIPAAEAAVAAAKRRVAIFDGEVIEQEIAGKRHDITGQKHKIKTVKTAGEVEKARALLAGAQAELDRASAALRGAKFVHLYADLMASTAPLAGIVATLSEKLAGLRAAAATEVHLREHNRAREQLTQLVRPILDDRAARAVGSVPRAPQAEKAPADPVEMIVRAGQNYGGHPAGEHVTIERRELANKSVRSTLMTLEEAAELASQQAAKVAEREEKRGIVPRIKSLVDEGLARLSAKGEAEAVERAAAEERRRRSDENLARLVEHQLAVAAAPTPEQRAMRVVLDQQGDNE